MKYYSEDVDKLIEELKIEDVIGDIVPLKKTGANYKGLCPFHPDTNPSFVVSPTKKICKCFVCGAGGNVIKFYSMYYKMSFEESIDALSKKYNISLRVYSKNKIKDEKNEKYYKLMKIAHKFYQDKIFENEGQIALEYFSNRGITPKIIRDNMLGYASSSWDSLYNFLITEGYDKEDIITLGLVKKGEKGVYDSFRNRVMFPIYSVKGDIIAFGGRSLENRKEVPKYINSSDTPIFKKGKNLYGINNRGNILKKKNYALLMEGYMDVLSAHNYGFDVAVASLGTAFTYDQGNLLKKYTKNVILSLDMDNAGQIATEKTAFILKNLGFNIRVLKLSNAKDPDEFLNKFGKDEFLKAVKNSLEIFDFLFEMYSKEYDLSNIMSKEKFLDRFKEFFKNVESVLERNLYLDRLSKILNIDKTILEEVLIKKNNFLQLKNNEENFLKKEKIKKEKVSHLEALTIELILAEVDYYSYFKDKKIESILCKKLFYYFENKISNKEKINSKDLKEFFNSPDVTKEEKEEIFMFNCRSIEFSDKEKLEENLKEIYKSWFVKEIKESQRVRKNIIMTTKLKKIESELYGDTKFENLLKEYDEFKKILIENEVL